MSSVEPVAWVLNLDAEDELAHEGPHTPSAAMTARIAGLVSRLSEPGGLINPHDQVLWPGERAVERGLRGNAWCPTRWALAQLERAGLRPPRSPGDEVLRRVNHRRFAQELGQALPTAGYASNATALAALLSARATLERTSVEACWLLKRPLGYAGRGRRKLRAGEVSAADQAWIAASLRVDGLQVEPWVTRTLDCALHGWLDGAGHCTFGKPTLLELDATGAWQSTTVAPAGALSAAELESLTLEAGRTATALHAAGYFGPFGIDAYRWRAPDGQVHFQPRCELNARYSMGWATGMGGFRAPSTIPGLE